MNNLPTRIYAIGLVLSTLLIVVASMLGVWAAWAWWYIAHMPSDQAAGLGMAVRLAPAVSTLTVVCLWIGSLAVMVGKAWVLPVIAHYRWQFGCCLGVVVGILLIAWQVLVMHPYQWGEQDEQMLLFGGGVGGLLFMIALVGGVGYWIVDRLGA